MGENCTRTSDCEKGLMCVNFVCIDEKEDPNLIWNDLSTGYGWSSKADTNRWTYYGAIDYCRNLSAGGVSNWRLPTISELRTLVRNHPPCQYPYPGFDP